MRPKLSAFRSTKLLYFGSKVVTIRVNVEFCCVTSVAYSSIYTAFVDYSKSSPLLSAAQVGDGGFTWLVHLFKVLNTCYSACDRI